MVTTTTRGIRAEKSQFIILRGRKMAVNNTYYPAYTYTPLSQAQNTYMAPTQTSPDNGIKWVQGEAGARACAINPGTSAVLMDSERDVFYIKTTELSGMPRPLRVFEFKEITAESQESTSKIGQTSFVTKDEFEERISKLEELLKSKGGKKHEQFVI
jgi:hypothetical protein